MSKSFIPQADAALLEWSLNFSTKLTAMAVSVGVDPDQATAYAGNHAGYATALAAAKAPATRSPVAILAKNEAKFALVEFARQLAKIIQSFPGTNDEARAELGLNVRKPRSPINPPENSPSIDLVKVSGRTVTVRLHDGSPKRGKPPGVSQAMVMTFVGASPPDETGAWKMEGGTTRTTFDVTFSPTLAPGATVWITAFWTNPRSQSGPACTPMSVTFGAAEVENSGSLKIAA